MHNKRIITKAQSAIRRGTQLAYDVAAQYGQQFDNVKDMDWFERVVCKYIKDQEMGA